jgi:hypothetical protein
VHGLIFASFQEFTRAHHPAASDAIWNGEPQYLPTEAYADEDFARVLGTAATLTNVDPREMQRQFGRFAAETTFRLLHPEYYEKSGSTRQFLLDIETRIHELVRGTIRGAAPPRLHVSALGDGVSISYTSERRLCDLLEGLVLGTAQHYRERYTVNQVLCMHRGDVGCVFHALPAV